MTAPQSTDEETEIGMSDQAGMKPMVNRLPASHPILSTTTREPAVSPRFCRLRGTKVNKE